MKKDFLFVLGMMLMAIGFAGCNYFKPVAEMHIYGDGKGPYELMPQTGETTTEMWSAQMIQWLKAKGYINKPLN